MYRNLEELKVNAARALALEAVAKGWTAGWMEGEDNGGNPFITLHMGKREGAYYTITWHTRDTGTYRLFSKMVRRVPGASWTDAPSLKAIRSAL